MPPALATHPTVDFLFLDTEFTSLSNPELISLGISGQHAEFYAERTDFPREKCSPFVHMQVLPKLGYAWDAHVRAEDIPARLADWLAGLPATALVLGYDYVDDLRLLMQYLPETWRNTLLPVDVRWDMSEDLFAAYFDQPGKLRHHALHDARGLRHSCAPWVDEMQRQVEDVLWHLHSFPSSDQVSFLSKRWPELDDAHPVQALNEGMGAAVRELARRLSAS